MHACTHAYTQVKRHFNHILVTSVALLLYVHDMQSSRSVYNSNQRSLSKVVQSYSGKPSTTIYNAVSIVFN